MAFLKTLQPAGRPVTPDTPLENNPPPARAMDNIWKVIVGVLVLVAILGGLAFLGWLVDEVGEDGVMFVLGGLLVFGFFVVCIFNTVNGLFDSMFGPRR